eukprot:233943-Prymnesium_polylepis.1
MSGDCSRARGKFGSHGKFCGSHRVVGRAAGLAARCGERLLRGRCCARGWLRTRGRHRPAR